MTEVKSKKDRLVKNPMRNPRQSLKAPIDCNLLYTIVSLSLRFEIMYMSTSRKQDFDYISHILF